MVAVPRAVPVARPAPGPPAESVATTVPPTTGTSTLVQVVARSVVTSLDVWSFHIATAANCWVPLIGIEAVAGFSRSDSNVLVVTFNVAELDRPPKVAVRVDVPRTLPVARPAPAPFGESVATAAPPRGTLAEVQLEDAVTLRDDPSLYVAVAVYCWVPLTGTEASVGVTARETRPGKPEPKIGSRPPPPPPPHPATKATRSDAMNNATNLE